MAWRDYHDLLRQMELDMNRFNEDTFLRFFENPAASAALRRFWQPAADIHQTNDGIAIKLEISGLATNNVSVALSGDGRRLEVSGVRAEPPDEREHRRGCHQLEIYFGPFERSFLLPPTFSVDRDKVTATLHDGFLTINLPRRAPQPTLSRIVPIVVSGE